jgi:hypothetical protein
MKKRQWPEFPVCSFCSHEETNDHLFYTCPISKVVWGVLGKAFDSASVPISFWQAMAKDLDFGFGFLPVLSERNSGILVLFGQIFG